MQQCVRTDTELFAGPEHNNHVDKSPAFCSAGTGDLFQGQNGRGVMLITSLPLVSTLRMNRDIYTCAPTICLHCFLLSVVYLTQSSCLRSSFLI